MTNLVHYLKEDANLRDQKIYILKTPQKKSQLIIKIYKEAKDLDFP